MGWVGKQDAVHALHGNQQQHQMVLHLTQVHTTWQQWAALDAQTHSIVQQLCVQ